MITIKARNGAMSQNDMAAVFERLMRGERAIFIIAKEKIAAAEAIFAKLDPQLRKLITISSEGA